MKTKDIIIATIAGIVLIIAVYFLYTMLFPASATTGGSGSTSKPTPTTTISGNIDTDTLDKLKQYKDYGGSTLDDIGRVNPFGPLN